MRSKLLFLGGSFICALLACDTIIGLDKVKKCDDVELVCEPLDASDAGDASDDAQTSDVLTLPDGVSEASSWPLWRMDNAPIEVQNGAADASLADFDASKGNVASALTTLTWINQLGFAGTIDEAVAFCKSVKGRLPTRIELASILDSTRKLGSNVPYTAPAFDKILISDAGSFPKELWSSSYARPVQNPLHFWFADLQTGDMLVDQGFTGTGVLCVQ